MTINIIECYPDIAASYSKVIMEKQLCEICKINPKTAKKLMTRYDIPYVNKIDGMLHYYEIRIEDALAIRYILEHGEYHDKQSKLMDFFKNELKSYGEVLTVKDVMEITGYKSTSVNNWIMKGKLKDFTYKKKNLILKQWLIEYMVKPEFYNKYVKSKKLRYVKSKKLRYYLTKMESFKCKEFF